MPDAASALSGILDAAAAPPEASYQRGAGTEGQLAYGEATQLNQASAGLPTGPAEAPAPAAATAPASAAEPPSGGGGAAEPAYSPKTDIERFLTGPTSQPMASPTASTELSLPDGYESWLVTAQAAAAMPDASYWVKSFVQRASEVARVVEQQRQATPSG